MLINHSVCRTKLMEDYNLAGAHDSNISTKPTGLLNGREVA